MSLLCLACNLKPNDYANQALKRTKRQSVACDVRLSRAGIDGTGHADRKKRKKRRIATVQKRAVIESTIERER